MILIENIILATHNPQIYIKVSGLLIECILNRKLISKLKELFVPLIAVWHDLKFAKWTICCQDNRFELQY